MLFCGQPLVCFCPVEEEILCLSMVIIVVYWDCAVGNTAGIKCVCLLFASRTGRKEARSIRLEESSHSSLPKEQSASSSGPCRGVIRDVRERFGFIERADVNSRVR